MTSRRRGTLGRIVLAGLLLGIGGCSGSRPVVPEIGFTVIPEAGAGGRARMAPIAGTVRRWQPQHRVVIYARSGTWWVQPYASTPFTEIQPDSTWRTETHLGTEYAALVVDEGYLPPKTTGKLPVAGMGGVLAVVQTPGIGADAQPQNGRLTFSGYEWEVMNRPTESGGLAHPNRTSNAWTDARGYLHLRMLREGDTFSCAEVVLTRSLGYGTYEFHLAAMPRFEPATVLGLFVWDPEEAGQNHRELDIELSQWGDRAARNAQYVVQPYYVPANVVRFDAPFGRPMMHAMQWQAGRALFRSTGADGREIASHIFQSGLPMPGNERVHLSLYFFGKARIPLQEGTEVVIERFFYRP